MQIRFNFSSTASLKGFSSIVDRLSLESDWIREIKSQTLKATFVNSQKKDWSRIFPQKFWNCHWVFWEREAYFAVTRRWFQNTKAAHSVYFSHRTQVHHEIWYNSNCGEDDTYDSTNSLNSPNVLPNIYIYELLFPLLSQTRCGWHLWFGQLWAAVSITATSQI